MKEDETDRTRGRSGRDKNYIQGFSWKTLRKEELGRPGQK
jgi:hypothetical protein